MRKFLISALYCLIPLLFFCQTDSTRSKSDEIDFDSFGDADNKKVKTFVCRR